MKKFRNSPIQSKYLNLPQKLSAYQTSSKVATPNLDETIWKVISRFDALIGATNVKAGFLLAFNTFIFSGIIFKVEKLIPRGYPIRGFTVLGLLAVIVIAAFICLVLTILIIKPDLSGSNNGMKSILYFLDVKSFESEDQFVKNIRQLNQKQIQADVFSQVYVLAGIATRKFKRLKWVFRIMLWGQVVPLALLILIKFTILFQSVLESRQGN